MTDSSSLENINLVLKINCASEEVLNKTNTYMLTESVALYDHHTVVLKGPGHPHHLGDHTQRLKELLLC